MLRPSPNHGTLRLPNDDDDDEVVSSPCRVFLLTYFLSRILTCPNHLCLAFLHLSVIFSTTFSPDVIIYHMCNSTVFVLLINTN